MIQRPANSLPPEYFEEKYRERLDYWHFEKSAYEAAKYAHTLEALPRSRYRSGFEVGCSIGVLTARLAERCERLLAVDVSTRALAAAQARCPSVQCKVMRFPQEAPRGRTFDLLVLSEVAYYWSRPELTTAQRLVESLLEPGGDLLLVHWTDEKTDYPLTGHEVHESFLSQPGLKPVLGENRPGYRLDLMRRAST